MKPQPKDKLTWKCLDTQLVGGFNPVEKYKSKWESSPNRGEKKKYLKPPPTQETKEMTSTSKLRGWLDVYLAPLNPSVELKISGSQVPSAKGGWEEKMGYKSTYLGVSKNNGTPKSSILIGFSIINRPFWGIPIFGNTHLV